MLHAGALQLPACDIHRHITGITIEVPAGGTCDGRYRAEHMTTNTHGPVAAAETEDGLLAITIDNGPGNPFDAVVGQSLAALVPRVTSARAVLISAAGPDFSMGGDVRVFSRADDPAAEVRALARDFHEFIGVLVEGPAPTVVAVQGWAAGAGLALAAACDIVVAGETTRMRAAYSAIGFTPDGGLTWTLPRRIGRGAALDLLITGRSIEAIEARERGLVTRLVADSELARIATEIAHGLAGGPLQALATTRELVRAGEWATLSEHLEAEADAIGDAAASAEGREGVTAFLERRRPTWTTTPRKASSIEG